MKFSPALDRKHLREFEYGIQIVPQNSVPNPRRELILAAMMKENLTSEDDERTPLNTIDEIDKDEENNRSIVLDSGKVKNNSLAFGL
jgi:hypothetical protein